MEYVYNRQYLLSFSNTLYTLWCLDIPTHNFVTMRVAIYIQSVKSFSKSPAVLSSTNCIIEIESKL